MRTAYLLFLLLLAGTACNSSSNSNQESSSGNRTTAGQDSSSIETLQKMAYSDGHIPQAWIVAFPENIQKEIKNENKEALVTRVWEISDGIHAIVLSLENGFGFEEVLLTHKRDEGIKEKLTIAYQFKNAINQDGFLEYLWLSDNSLRLTSRLDDKGQIEEKETTWVIQKTGDIIRPITSYPINPSSYSGSFLDFSNFTFKDDQIFVGSTMVGKFPTSLDLGEVYRFENEDGYTLLMVKRLNYSSMAFFFRMKDRIVSGTAELDIYSVQNPVSLETQIGLREVAEYVITSSTDPCIEKLQFIEVLGDDTIETSGMIIRTSNDCSLKFADQTELYIPD